VLRVSSELLPQIANNMLGDDDLRPDYQQRDALGELANVICGNLLPQLGGPSAAFLLDAPQVSLSEPPVAEQPAARACIALEDGCAELLLFLQGVPPGCAAS
jgi:hypothetical protein